MTPITSPSHVTQPFLLSVKADIPPGCAIDVLVEGKYPNGSVYRKVFRNPKDQPLDTLTEINIDLLMSQPHESLACPFLFALELEGNHQKQEWLAEHLVNENSPTETLMLVRPPKKSPYATIRSYIKHIYSSEVQRPWILSVEGIAQGDSSLKVIVDAELSDGTKWNHIFQGPCREEIPHTDLTSIRYGIHMEPSSDGVYSPQLFGVAIEGDGRRLLQKAADFQADVGSTFMILTLTDGDSVMMLQPLLPQFSSPPSILHKLHEMQDRGELTPRSSSESSSEI